MRRKARGLLSKAAAVGAIAAGAQAGWAQVSYTGATYSQNFDGLTNTVEGVYTPPQSLTAAPVNGVGMEGWVMSKVGGSGVTRYVYNDGSDTRIGLLGSFGFEDTNSITDRALGSTSSSTTSIHRFGVLLKNDSTTIYTKLNIAFDVEQYRRNSQSGTIVNLFGVATGGSTLNLDNGTYTNISGMEWGPVNTATDNVRLDGNAVGNFAHKAVTDFAIPAWAPGPVS
jgi:hypothetical protein